MRLGSVLRLITPLVCGVLAALFPTGCTLFLAANTPCDSNADCNGNANLVCTGGFCAPAVAQGAEGEGGAGGEGEGEGEGGAGGEGEGEGGAAGEGEGEGGAGGEGEGEGGAGGEGEGEGGAGGEGEGEGGAGGEGEGEGGGPTTVLLCGENHVVPAWFDPSFPFRVPFAFCDTTAPNEDVAGLPVTISLTAAGFPELDSIAANGRDVIFVDERGTPTVLPYERQLYADNSAAIFNVRIPHMNPSTGLDDVWMYFGSNDNVERSSPPTTYPDYSSVWHFETGAELNDAISGVAPATSIGFGGANISSVAGLIGQGLNFVGTTGDGTGSFAFLQPLNANAAIPPPTPPPTSAASFSMLAFPRTLATGGQSGEFTIMMAATAANIGCANDHLAICTLFFNNGTYQAYVPNAQNLFPPLLGAQNALSSNGGVVPTNVFKHHSLSWSAAQGVVGTFDGNTVINAAVTPNATFAIRNIVLGMAEQNNNGPFNGVIDEVRISNVPRAATFYRAESKAYAGALLQRGVVEAR